MKLNRHKGVATSLGCCAKTGLIYNTRPFEQPEALFGKTMVTIRLARHGSKKSPFYHITVADKDASRDGRFIERLGFYNPMAKGQAEGFRLNLERVDYWMSVGAQPTDRVKQLVKQARKQATVPAPEAVA